MSGLWKSAPLLVLSPFQRGLSPIVIHHPALLDGEGDSELGELLHVLQSLAPSQTVHGCSRIMLTS